MNQLDFHKIRKRINAFDIYYNYISERFRFELITKNRRKNKYLKAIHKLIISIGKYLNRSNLLARNQLAGKFEKKIILNFTAKCT